MNERTPTHPDLKSVDPNIRDADDILEYIYGALEYQWMFDTRTTPWERDQWDDKELQNFKIMVEYIDRIYHIWFYDDGVTGQEFRLIARMDYGGQHLYVEMNANCDFTGFDCQGQGNFYVSRDANLFMKTVLNKACKSHLIYKSLQEDGIICEEQTEYDSVKRMFWRNPPLLKYLCHESVYKNQNLLNSYYPKVLPNLLVISVRDFIKVKETRKDYDDM